MDNWCWFCMTETMKGGKCRVCHRKPPSPDGKYDLALPPGATLSRGRFMVGAKLGKGGFGITYTGLDREKNTPIAIKEFFPKHLVTGREGTALAYPPEKQEEFDRIVRSFRKEADIINHLKRDPGIVHVKYRFDDNNTAYIGMELLRGTDLRQYISALPRPLSALDAFQLLLPVMNAIQFIHENNVLHRDISPDNIFLCQEEGRPNLPKLIDFGAAHIAVNEFTQSYPNVRKSGYSPLEQNWATDSQGAWMDVYSFAATFYYAITGKVPLASVERSGKVDKLPPPSKLGAEIPPAAEKVLLKGMAVRVADRYASMAAFRDAMREALPLQAPAAARKSEVKRTPPQSAPQTHKMSSLPPAPRQKELSGWVRAWVYLGNLLIFCGGAGLALGIPGLFLGLPLMALINTGLEFLEPHASLCMRLTPWRVQNTSAAGSPTLGQCLLRNLLLAIVPFVAGEWLWMMLKGESQMPHDIVTGTRLFRPGGGVAEDQSQPAPMDRTRSPEGLSSPLPRAQDIGLTCLEGVMQGQKWQGGQMLRIGRSKERNDVVVSQGDGLVSKSHCVIFQRDGGYYLRDNDSRNGTYLNGEKLGAKDGTRRLKHGDQVRAGHEIFVIELQ